jgi:hypothetical protein
MDGTVQLSTLEDDEGVAFCVLVDDHVPVIRLVYAVLSELRDGVVEYGRWINQPKSRRPISALRQPEE